MFDALKRAWPHARAAFVLFHLLMIFLVAFPAPVGGLDRALWKDPTAQQEFASWSKLFHVDQAAFEEFLYQAAVTYMQGRDAVIRPFVRYVGWTGCDQPWRMFVGPQRYPSRFQIQVHRKDQPAEEWETLFEEHSPKHRWHADLFNEERLRSQIFRWTWPSFSGEYQVACAYLARLEFSEDPTAADLRCRFWHTQSPSPEQVRSHSEPGGSWSQTQLVTRGAGH